jgi:hypothetical protein
MSPVSRPTSKDSKQIRTVLPHCIVSSEAYVVFGEKTFINESKHGGKRRDDKFRVHAGSMSLAIEREDQYCSR